MVTQTLPHEAADQRVRRTVKLLLAAHEMTTMTLADHIDLSKNQIYDRLRGEKPFTVAEVAAMAELFGVSVQQFVDGPEAMLGSDAASSRENIGGNEPGFRTARTLTRADLALIA